MAAEATAVADAPRHNTSLNFSTCLSPVIRFLYSFFPSYCHAIRFNVSLCSQWCFKDLEFCLGYSKHLVDMNMFVYLGELNPLNK